MLCLSDAKSRLIGKDPDAGQEEKGMTEDEMVGWHHWLNEHEFEQTPGDGEGQGSLACCSPWAHKELDMTEWLNNNKCTSQNDLPTPPYVKILSPSFSLWWHIFQQTKVYVPQSQGEFRLPALGPGRVCTRPPLYLPNYQCLGKTVQILQTSSKTYWWEKTLKGVYFIS